ncbi:alpha/beta hydrolase [Agrobacterium pusense]|jgi:acetyl esterase/lipase|uniref:alpha/beta hydrolase n=1 Tax=Agrobacterium pusense TaxID=648995 RepID=UPI0024528282|nr:prolyl oligopeptidase family serine peptidase [Agrobacterium pusense]
MIKTFLLAWVPFLFDPTAGRTETATPLSERAETTEQRRLLSATSTIGDVLRHPAFFGYARHIFPWDNRPYDEAMRLSDIGGLLPYHSAIDTGIVLGGLNRMIEDVAAGRQVFYDLYSEDDKRQDPTKENTGLFLFRGRRGAPFAIVSPGGGFAYVGSVHEGFPYAVEINRQGYNVFVLKYRIGQGGRAATADLAAAVSFVFRNSETLDVATDGYSLWGSSAGARMAASIGSHGVAAFGGDDLPAPAAVVMAYTAHFDHSNSEPPTFVVVGSDDGIAPPSSMERRISALKRLGTQVEYHKFAAVGHGFGTGTGTSAEGWITDATRFWERSRCRRKL